MARPLLYPFASDERADRGNETMKTSTTVKPVVKPAARPAVKTRIKAGARPVGACA